MAERDDAETVAWVENGDQVAWGQPGRFNMLNYG